MRWPLLVDPQLQGIKWLKAQMENEMERRNRKSSTQSTDAPSIESLTSLDRSLKIYTVGQKRWVQSIIQSISRGDTVILVGVGESVDAVLDPILGRAIYKKGKNFFMRMGGEDIEYDPHFRLLLQ